MSDVANQAQSSKEKEIGTATQYLFQHNLDVFISRICSLGDHFGVAIAAIKALNTEVENQFDKFVETKLERVPENDKVYTIPEEEYNEFFRLRRKLERSRLALRSVPRGLAVALVSEFDFFMGATLKAFYRAKPEALNASQRTMTFEELSTFESISAAREYLLEKEVESFLRSSHTEQFEILEKKVGIPLRKDLDVWSGFIELTERRNLFVHNDGVANSQYLNICGVSGYDCANIKVGTKLEVQEDYFQRSLDILYELAVKLSHVLWRKLVPEDAEQADGHFSGIVVYDLIYEEKLKLAIILSDFGVKTFKKWGSDYHRRSLIINRAQAYIWSGEREKGIQILEEEDWTAASDDFQVCIAALRQDVREVVRYMKKLGRSSGPKKDGFREWPVFRELRAEKEFQQAFHEVFGEPFATVTLDTP